ncbi:glycosyltransferase family protein [Niastella vici]|uniref:glycosyltransferase family 4 protein n=1 Tax=Niastella vici TaxID=1703345 RepID=UPI001180EC9E|nr:glycosyltransferase family 4 protein [Niastella vici]
MKAQVKLLTKAIGLRPDIVWCFDPYRFLNLKWFKASVNIFFAADLFYYDHLPEEAFTADVCLGVSDTIVELLKPACKTAHFINHGVNRHFTRIAQEALDQLPGTIHPKSKITVGYVGNLLMEAPDRNTMKKVISAHPDTQFVFWGQYEIKGNFVAFDKPEVFDFVRFLQSQPNVVLRGAVHPSVLSEEVKMADMFWVCWQTTTSKMWDGSNSHKILEYLSTGKPVVSHYMSTYRDNNIIDMLDSKDNSEYLSLFSQILKRVRSGELTDLQRDRILFAMENSYRSHIAGIEKLIESRFS